MLVPKKKLNFTRVNLKMCSIKDISAIYPRFMGSIELIQIVLLLFYSPYKHEFVNKYVLNLRYASWTPRSPLWFYLFSSHFFSFLHRCSAKYNYKLNLAFKELLGRMELNTQRRAALEAKPATGRNRGLLTATFHRSRNQTEDDTGGGVSHPTCRIL